MAIAVQSSSELDYASRTTITLTKPSGTVDGDLLIAVVTHGTDKSLSTVPSGWTQMATVTSVDTGLATFLYHKVASSEGASWDWVLNASTFTAGAVLRVDGQKSSGFADQSNTDSVTNDESPTYDVTITPSNVESLLVYVIVGDNGANASATSYAVTTDDPSWTEHVDVNSTGRLLTVASAVRTEDSATGNATVAITADGTDTIDTDAILANFLPDPDAIIPLDTVGDLTLSGNEITFKLDMNFDIDSAGDLTLSGNDITVNTQTKISYSNQSKSSSSWTNQSKS